MNPSSKSFPRSIDKGVVMKKEKKESALEELYAPPTSSDETSSESAAERWSVGLVMDVVLIIATILASTSWILLARFADHNPLNLPSATIETLDSIVDCLYNVLRYLGGGDSTRRRSRKNNRVYSDGQKRNGVESRMVDVLDLRRRRWAHMGKPGCLRATLRARVCSNAA